MKKNIMIFLSLGVLLLIFILSISSYKTDGEIAEDTLESITGNSLYNIWNNYDAILKHPIGEISIDSIKEINNNLKIIEIYSNVVDQVVGKEILNPITNNFLKITNDIENNYAKNKMFTEQDKKNYEKLLEEVKNLIPLIDNTYYVSDSQEGAKVTLEIKNIDELKKLNNRLINIKTR